MLRLLVVEVGMSSSFTETASVETVQTDQDSIGIILNISLSSQATGASELTWPSKQSVHSSLDVSSVTTNR